MNAPPRRLPSRFALTLLAIVALVVVAVILASRIGAVNTSPDTHSVTVTAPQAPSVTLPRIDGTTQAELAVLGSGPGWDAAARSLGLWLADRLLWPGFAGLVIAALLFALPVVPNEWAMRLGIGCAVLVAIGLFAPAVALMLQAGEGVRDSVVMHGLASPTPGVR